MNILTGTIGDIASTHNIRMAVKENVLNNPALGTEADYTISLPNMEKDGLVK